MPTIAEALALGFQHHQAGRLHAAEQLYRQVLAADPDHPEALHLLGLLLHQLGQPDAAIAYLTCAIARKNTDATYHHNLGEVYRALRRAPEAIACYQRALALQPDFATACFNLGLVYQESGQLQAAADCYSRVVQLQPSFAPAHRNLGVMLQALGQRDAAIAAYRRALELQPDPMIWNNLGNALQEQGELDQAIACYRCALELQPDQPETHNNLGIALTALGQLDSARTCFRRAVQLRPDYAEAWNSLGVALQEQGEGAEAMACFRRAWDAKPDYLEALGALIHARQQVCQWDELPDLCARLMATIDAPNPHATAAAPFTLLALPTPTTPAQQLRCARQWAAHQFSAHPPCAARAAAPLPKTKLTIGYLSADFHAHATAWLAAELFEKHDRAQVTVFAYSHGPDDASPMRHRLRAAFDRFTDIRRDSFAQAAQRIAADGVDILVDLKGYTTQARPGILALRPAPIQVHFLGYPGTLGTDFVDYILVDDYVVPAEQQPFFTENLVHLPGCYQVNDSRRGSAVETPTRAACGLPPEGFVFCSFNNNYKITPMIFDVWMRLLKAVSGSVLWLLEANRFVPANLRREAEARGVAPERLVFAPRAALPEHLARHRRADLFLDTFPYNAHTTASDALFAGLPLVTLSGDTFASRVAGSLLHTLGLSDLITSTPQDYEARALQLATHPEGLAAIRARLAAGRISSPLFRAAPFARHLERAYRTMWEFHASGQKPRPFAVPPA